MFSIVGIELGGCGYRKDRESFRKHLTRASSQISYTCTHHYFIVAVSVMNTRP